jgi:uncharacterized membrane protein YhaH (DUF805 family)
MSIDIRPLRLLRWLFTWNGAAPRGQYLAAGSVLLAIKYAIDHWIASLYGQPWHVWNYFFPTRQTSLIHMTNRHMYLALWAVALPFFWMGIALTLRRLRSTGHKTSLVFLFFVPVLNLVFFLMLCLLPAGETEAASMAPTNAGGPRDVMASAALGVLLSIGLALLFVVLSVTGFDRYGFGVFLGVPFAVGFISAAIFNHGQRRTLAATEGVATCATLLLGVVLFSVAYEGVVCLLMALPLALPFATGGAFLAWRVQSGSDKLRSRPTMAAWVLVLPLVMFVEHAANPRPPVLAVTTAVEINAPADVVWNHVVSFSPLAPPKELLFQAGIAYPTSAVIRGRGIGAIRYCRFSTGDFVEPITTWDAGRLLAFDVVAQPMAMRELSFAEIMPPHLERNYMRSRRGQFRLIPLSDGRMRLEGTTWYQNYFWPQPYWRMWSDYIVHRIHMRVLLHVKAEAERASAGGASGSSREQ